MTLKILKNADVVVSMDDDRNEYKSGYLAFKDGVITAIGEGEPPSQLSEKATIIEDVKGCVITPGLVNTHHHLFQTITRGVPAAQNSLLFGWLETLYPIWSKLRSEDVYASAKLGLAELAATGCTLTSDHHYLYPNDVTLDDTIHAAQDVGIRLLATRGSMSIGQSKGGLPPDTLTENENDILEDCIRVIDKFHSSNPDGKIQIGVAPCSPFSVSQDLMKNSAILARDKGVRLHTHLAENIEDVKYSLENFGCRPGQYAEDLGWVGEDVWHAHCVQLDESEIELFAKTKTGVAHCPCSNCRLGSGIAPVKDMIHAGIPVGIGVDGSASNDIAHLLNETRQSLLLQRVKYGADAITAREVLELSTRGGADILGRPDCGRIAIGCRADIAVWDMTNLHSAGNWDPVSALVLSGPNSARHLIVEGDFIIKDDNFTQFDIEQTIQSANASTQYLIKNS